MKKIIILAISSFALSGCDTGIADNHISAHAIYRSDAFSPEIQTKTHKIMIVTLLTIANIAGGLLLGLATLDKLDGAHNFFNKIAGILAPFQTVIGGVLVVLGFMRLIGNGSWIFNAVSIVGGFLLLTHVIGKAPAFKNTLQKLSDKLMPFKAIIGIALLVIGLITVFN